MIDDLRDGWTWYHNPYQFLDQALQERGLTFPLRLPVLGETLVTGEPALIGEMPLDAGLGAYRRARRRAFAGKWAVERLIGYAMLLPGFFDRAVERLERRGLSHTLIGVTGDYLPARHVLNPRFLSQVML